ncbi:hypothetical protein [Streptomyces sp. NPDC059009]|uniref:hypothetical protein n=1 Tax=Streptomyces sp. NPDC059009 TaxID=3346694 RepID=UPI00368ADD34
MSTPNPQPGPYGPNPYQQPQGAGSPQPYGQQPGPYGRQPGPYGQPPQAGVQGGPQAGMPGGPPPAPPAPPGGPRKAVGGWVWGLGGVVLASALWAGGLFATGNLGSDSSGGGGGDDKPSLAGYAYRQNLCDVTKLSALLKRYERDPQSKADTHWGSRQKPLDQSQCTRKLMDPKSSSEYASTYVYATAAWHKKADPAHEFSSYQKAREDQSQDTYTYRTKAVKGLGDEAFVTTETGGSSGRKQLQSMVVAVREGGFTMDMQWSNYGGASADADKAPTADEVEKMLMADTREAMEGLKK